MARELVPSINQQHGIHFKRAPKCWVEEPIMLVFEQMTTEWYDAPVNQLLSTVGKQGGLHPIRRNYTYMVWVFEASSMQQYFVRLLNTTPHYAIRWRHWPDFKRHLEKNRYKYQFIPQDQSFIPQPSTDETPEDDKPFLAVINFGTKEMDDKMVAIIEDGMNLAANFDILSGVEPDESRGNLQKSYGFSPLGYNRREENHCIAEPQELTGNDDERVRQKYCAQSKLILYTAGKYPGIKELLGEPDDKVLAMQRKRLFAQRIHPENILEGNTLGLNELSAGTIQAVNIPHFPTALLLCHVDVGNDPTPGNQFQHVCSAVLAAFKDPAQVEDVFNSKTKDGNINSFYRSWEGGYLKHACLQAMIRRQWMSIIIDVLDTFYNSQEEWRRNQMATLRHVSGPARERFQNGENFYQFIRSFTKSIMLGTIHDSKLIVHCYCDWLYNVYWRIFDTNSCMLIFLLLNPPFFVHE